jgi:hypothetical protein
MNFEIQNGNFSKALDKQEFSIDLINKEAGFIGKQSAIAEVEDARSKAGQLSVEIEAKRPGPKSSAQTPAKPSERKEGSSKNKSGSAGTNGDAITFSAKVIEMLKNKVKNHNAKHSRKVSLSQLKKVYRRGAGAFSSSHRPGMTRGGWAVARVNMFLRMMSGGKVKDAYRKADQDVAKSSLNVIDVSDSWEPEEEDFAQASLDILEIGDFNFDSVDELYLDEDSNVEKWYEI